MAQKNKHKKNGETAINPFIRTQCKTMAFSLQTFEQACRLAAQQDDGEISKEEEKVLKKIYSAAESFRNVLESI